MAQVPPGAGVTNLVTVKKVKKVEMFITLFISFSSYKKQLKTI